MNTLKHFFYSFISCMFLFTFTACEKDGPSSDIIYDFYPINLYFTLTGENGEDLLNPAIPGSYAGLRITATYENSTYEKDLIVDNLIPHGRAFLANMFGIHTKQLKDGRYALCFGEFDGADTYKDATVTLDWKDGTTDVVTFSSKVKWHGDDPRITRSFLLNGNQIAKDVCDPIFEIKKPALQGGLEKGWNISPLKFHIYLSNKKNQDLLNQTVDNHISLYDVKAIFREKEYSINNDPQESETDQPVFNGLTRFWHDQNRTTPHPIYFGELDGTESFEDEMLIMDWGTLGRDTITFTSKIVWENDKPIFIRHFELNGKEVDKDTSYPIIRIKKDIE